MYESLRRYGAKEASLRPGRSTRRDESTCCTFRWATRSPACWTEFFRDMAGRGLRTPVTVTSDGAPGLINAIGQAFGEAIRIRCRYHKMGNIRTKLPAEAADEVTHGCGRFPA